MEERLGIQKNKGASRIIMTLVMFFVLMASIFLVSCSSGNITITYKTILDQERGFVVKKGSTIAELGEAEPVTGYTFEGWYKDQAFYARYGNEEKLEKDTTIYAKYLPNKYKVVFHSNNGLDETDVYTYEFNSTFKLATNTFTLDHYTFVGWSKDENDVEGSNTIEAQGKEVQLTTEGADYYAIWASNDIAIEYNFDEALLDGEAIETANLQNVVKYNTMLTLPTFSGTITKVGDDLNDYTFAGFKIGEVVYEAGRKVNVTAAIMENETITISIEWISVNEGLASFNLNKPVIDQKEISGIASIHLERDENDNFVFTLPSCENLYGHTFLGWSVGGTDEVLEAGEQYTTTRSLTTFNAVWQAQQRTITLVDGDSSTTIETTYGEQITLPSTGSPAGDYTRTDRWRFDGWKKELPEVAPTTNYSGQLAVVANASNNYLFESSSLTLYASYYRKQVTLEFIANGGDGAIENIAVNTADTYTVTPTTYNRLSRQYYSLVGFSTNSDAVIGSFAIEVGTEDMTLYAIWSRNQITISYDNEESTVPTDFQMDQGSYLTFSGNGLEKSGYRLIGFKIDGDTSDVVYQVGQQVFLTENTTLIPQWTDLDYINFRGVGYDAGVKPTVVKSDGTTSSTAELAVGDEIILPTYSSANDSYVDKNGTRLYFAGWSKEQNAEAPSYFANSKYVVNNNVDVDIFYPVFMPATLTALSFTLDTANHTATVKYNGEALPAGNILIYPNIYVENDTTYQVTTLDTLTSATSTKKPTTAQHIILAEGIKTIGSYSFRNCTALTDVLIPTSVTTIMTNAFSGCSSFGVLWISENVKTIGASAFGDTHNLSFIGYNATNANAATTTGLFYRSGKNTTGITLVIGENVTSIPDYYFYNYNGSGYSPKIKTVKMGSNVTKIGKYAFRYCTSITSLTIPNGVTSIGEYAFANCSALTSINIPAGITSLPNYIFSGCSSLTSMTIPDNITTMGNNTFSGCTHLTSVVLGDGLTTIGTNTFNNCSALESLSIGENLTTFGSGTFNGCTSLATITINPNNTYYESSGNCLIEKATGTILKGVNNSTIPTDESVTIIGNNAFQGCTGLTNIVIPDNITTIGNYAFASCTGLTGITISNSVTSIGSYAFSGCSSLVNLTIPNSVTGIGQYAFQNCTSLANLILPDDFVNININMFSGCNDSLFKEFNNAYYLASNSNNYNVLVKAKTKTITNYEIHQGTKAIVDSAFKDCTYLTAIVIPEGVISIGSSAFMGCTALTSVTIPESVTTIKSYAFRNCSALTTVNYNAINVPNLSNGSATFINAGHEGNGIAVTIGDNVTTIPSYLFCKDASNGISGSKAPKVISVVMGNNVTAIGSNAFSYNPYLTSITFGNSVESIGSNAFYGTSITSFALPASINNVSGGLDGCSYLESITVDANNTTYHSEGNCLIETATGTLILGCKNSVIPTDGSVTSIRSYAFEKCAGLTSINIPDSITSLNDRAFYNCSGLTTLTLPETLTSIGAWTFSGCSSLTTVAIPDSVTNIGKYAFYQCSGMTSVSLGNGIQTIGESAFYGCTGLTTVSIDVTSLTTGIFNGCTNITTFNIGPNVTNIAGTVLGSSPNLTNISVDSNNTNYYVEGNCLINTTTHTLVKGFNNSVIPTDGSVTKIGDYAFKNCTGLTTLTIPEGITSIGTYAFSGCSGLTTLTLPAGLTSIGSFAFYDCTSLTSVTIPEGVTKIENGTFKYCYVLAELNLPSTLTQFDNASLHSCVELKNGTEAAPRIHYNGTSTQFNAILRRTHVTFEIPGTTKKDRGTYKFYVQCTNTVILTELDYTAYAGPF